MAFRRDISLPFLGNHMDKDCPVDFCSFPQHPEHSPDIMAVHRPKVGNPHIFKEHPRDEKLFDAAFGPADLFYHPLPVNRDFIQGIGDACFQPLICVCGPQVAQMAGKPAYIF